MIKYIVLAIGVALVAMTISLGCRASNEQVQDTLMFMETVTYREHSYIVFRHRAEDNIVVKHDPDCPNARCAVNRLRGGLE